MFNKSRSPFLLLAPFTPFAGSAETDAAFQKIADDFLRGSLCKWICWFREGGIEELLGHANGAGGGKEPRFSPPQWERFRAELAKGQWRTARDAQRWLKQTLGLEIAYKEVYRHLGKLGARLKVRVP